MKTNCPQLASRLAQAPALGTPRITEGIRGRPEPPKARGRAFQLIAEEARTAADVVVGMFLSLILLIILFYAYMFVPMIRYVLSELLTCFGII